MIDSNLLTIREQHVYYHADNDGFASAWAFCHSCGPILEDKKAREAREAELPVRTDYVPIDYGNEKKRVTYEFPKPTSVFFLDYCPKAETVEKLLESENVVSITVIDHHESGVKRSAEFPKDPRIDVMIDMEHSGCVLAWREFNFDAEFPPLLLQYVEDRDLWKFELPDTHAVNARLAGEEHDFARWEALYKLFQLTPSDTNGVLGFAEYVEQGKAILEHQRQAIERICFAAREVHLFGFLVPIVNTQYAMSDVGNYLNDKYPEAKFAVIWYMTKNGGVKVSLRTQRDDFNVAELAERFGGGGHPKAAGIYLKPREGRDVDIFNLFMDEVADLSVMGITQISSKERSLV